MDPLFGEGYPGDKNKPSGLRIIAAVDSAGSLEDLTDGTDMWTDHESLSIERNNENGSSATASFEVIFPNGSGSDIVPWRYVAIDDPDTPNGLGGPLGYFAGYIMNPEPTEAGNERTNTVRCVDYGVLADKGPKQITTQWPPGDGTPIVNTTIDTSIPTGTQTFIPVSFRHLYAGKKVYAQNSDGSNSERITILGVDEDLGTVTAVFSTTKTSTSTMVPTSLHATGLQTITPDSMANINVGSILYCKKHHGVQTSGNEFVIVTAVTSTTFTAYFTAWKTHDWEVQSYWQLVGGLTDKELIADGWSQHVETIDEFGEITTELIEVNSLLDEYYNFAGLSVDKTAVEEIILSLPHGKWSGASPRDVLDWVTQQASDPDIDPRWYFTFVQPTTMVLSTMLPKLRYYDARNTPDVLAIELTNDPDELDPDTQARFKTYNFPEDGRAFANKLTVMGSLDSIGSWQDDDSISNTLADNYVGRVIEHEVIRENELTTNEACTLRAAEIAAQQRLSERRHYANTDTHAQLDPMVLYEPQIVHFFAQFEPSLPADLEVRSVRLSFDGNGMAVYNFVLGDRPLTRPPGGHVPKRFRRGVVDTNPTGDVSDAGPSRTMYLTTHAMITDAADVYVADASDGPISIYLPPAKNHPGLPITVKAPNGPTDVVTIYAYQRGGMVDGIDGAPSVVLQAGESKMFQSAGEYDESGYGGQWHEVGNVPPGGAAPWLQGGNSFGADGIFGTFDEFDVRFYRNAEERLNFMPNGNNMSMDTGTNYAVGLGIYPTTGNSDSINNALDAEIAMTAASGTVPAGSSGIFGGIFVNAGAAVFTQLDGIRGGGAHFGTGTVNLFTALYAQHIDHSGAGSVERAIGVYGALQDVGTIENWSGYFVGGVYLGSLAEFPEVSAPSTPGSNRVRLYAKDKAGTSNLYFKDDAGVEHDLAGASGITNPYDIETNTLRFRDNGTVDLITFHLTTDELSDLVTMIDFSQGFDSNDNGSRYTLLRSANTRLQFRDDVSSTVDQSGIFIRANVEMQPKQVEHVDTLSLNTGLLLRAGDNYASFTGDLFRVYDEEHGLEAMNVYPNGDVVFSRNHGTSTTYGHLYIPSCAGTPTGVPQYAGGGAVAVKYDRTANLLYVYDGGWNVV